MGAVGKKKLTLVSDETENNGTYTWTPSGVFDGKDNYYINICDKTIEDCTYTFDGRFTISDGSSSSSSSSSLVTPSSASTRSVYNCKVLERLCADSFALVQYPLHHDISGSNVSYTGSKHFIHPQFLIDTSCLHQIRPVFRRKGCTRRCFWSSRGWRYCAWGLFLGSKTQTTESE